MGQSVSASPPITPKRRWIISLNISPDHTKIAGYLALLEGLSKVARERIRIKLLLKGTNKEFAKYFNY